MNVTITIDSNIREQKDVGVPGTGEIAETYLKLQYIFLTTGEYHLFFYFFPAASLVTCL